MTGPLPFWKYQGIGNDFVLVDQPVDAQRATSICHRSLGIGADGVLIVTDSDGGDSARTVEVINSDGSPAEICGNGLRCVALHVYEATGASESSFLFETGAGLRRCEIIEHIRKGQGVVEVEMGRPTLDRQTVPALGEGTMVEEKIDIAGRSFPVTAVGMGNPHAVIFETATTQDVTTFGPVLEKHCLFPAGVNAGFAKMSRPDHIDLIVWERGAGLTGACGSGACAAAVAACITERAQRGKPIVVSQPGGELTITVADDDSQVLMRGPTRRVFSGQVDLDLLL